MRIDFKRLFGAGADAPAVIGPDSEQIVSDLHGKYYTAAKMGRVFSQATTPLGLAIPIYTATALGGGALPLWNPPNSGVNAVLIAANVARASGTADFGAIGLMARKLDSIATGQVMTALGDTVPVNGNLFGGAAPRTRSSNAGTNTVTAGVAGDYIRNLFTFNLEADTGTAHATTLAQVDFDGSVIVPPGVLVYLAATKASGALFASSLTWEEVPLS